MVVQQDQLPSTDTNITMSGFNNEVLATQSGWVDRALHNGTDILKTTLWGKSGQSIVPQFKYYQTNGTEKVSYTPEQSNLLDVCYEQVSGKYFSIRFESNVISGTLQDPDDAFNVGTLFDLNKWISLQELRNSDAPTASVAVYDSATEFTKLATSLSFNTTLDKKYLRSRYYLPQGWEATIDYNVTTLTGNRSASFGLMASEYSTGHSVYEVGITRSGSSDFFYNALRTAFAQYGVASLSDFVFDVNLLPSGTVDWTLSKSGTGIWLVQNSLGFFSSVVAASGAVTLTGVGFSSSLTNGSAPNTSDLITFTTKYRLVDRPTSSGTLYVSRTNNDFSTANSVDFNETIALGTSDSKVSIVGQNLGSILNITADNFNITTGNPIFPAYPTLKVERINEQGIVQQNIINYLEVLPSNTPYSALISGAVGIAVSPSQVMYAKVFDKIYSFTCTGTIGGSGLTTTGTGGITTSPSGIIPASGITSFMYSDLSSTSLNYIKYDSNTGEVRFKSLSTAQPPVPTAKEVFLDVSDYGAWQVSTSVKPYQFFLHGVDTNSLFYIKKSDNRLRQFNIDPAISAFSAVNSDDYSLQVGTNDTATISVEVINAWGEYLNGKTVSFLLIQGDGVVSPASAVTSGLGLATTQYTAGALAGAIQVQVTVSD